MRREFDLPEDDVEQLNLLGLGWETINASNSNQQWLLLHGFPFPSGYNRVDGSVAIQIPVGYPVAGLDMAYFYPHLQRTDGQALRQTQCIMTIDGKDWQRWSRHYSWVAGQHSLSTHILLVRHWLNHGLGKK
jgi:hypothetical protein